MLSEVFEGDDFDDGLDEVFFPGSDDELGFLEEIEADEEHVSLYVSLEYLHVLQNSFCSDMCDDDNTPRIDR